MKNIVIVGGSSGIGLALVQNLLSEGNSLTNISRSPCAVAGVTNIRADVTDPAALKKAFDRIDRIDAVVYCAGFSLAAPIECVKRKDYEYLFDVNILGAIECAKLAIPLLEKSEDPRLIFLSSSGSVAPIPYDGFYSAAKAGLVPLAYAVRMESKIKSTAVIIGGTQTRFSFTRKVYDDCETHNARLKSAADSLIKIEQTGYSADFVAKRIANIISASNPPPKVTVGIKNKLELFAYNILPWRIKLCALMKKFEIQN